MKNYNLKQLMNLFHNTVSVVFGQPSKPANRRGFLRLLSVKQQQQQRHPSQLYHARYRTIRQRYSCDVRAWWRPVRAAIIPGLAI